MNVVSLTGSNHCSPGVLGALVSAGANYASKTEGTGGDVLLTVCARARAHCAQARPGRAASAKRPCCALSARACASPRHSAHSWSGGAPARQPTSQMGEYAIKGYNLATETWDDKVAPKLREIDGYDQVDEAFSKASSFLDEQAVGEELSERGCCLAATAAIFVCLLSTRMRAPSRALPPPIPVRRANCSPNTALVSLTWVWAGVLGVLPFMVVVARARSR